MGRGKEWTRDEERGRKSEEEMINTQRDTECDSELQ